MPKTLYEYYTSKGQALPSVSARAPEYAKLTGRTDAYRGTAEQNTLFLSSLLKPPAPVAPVTQPSVIPTSNSPVVSSTQVRSQMAERGANPATTTFPSEQQFQEFVQRVQPTTPAPQRTSLVDQYTKLQDQHGTAKLQTDLQALDDEDAQIDAALRQFRAKETEGVSQEFGTGRISEAERNVLERREYINRQRNSLVGRINSANKSIETIMSLTDKDYTNAREEYESEYERNLSLLDTFRDMRREARDEQSEARDDARANLTTIYNALADNSVDPATLSATQRTHIEQLELEAGLPSGFFDTIKEAVPNGKMLSHTAYEDNSGRKYTDVIFQMPDGSINVETIAHTPTRSTPEPTSTTSPTTRSTTTSTPKSNKPTWEQFLKAAEMEARMSIGPAGRAELRRMYDAEYGTAATAKPSSGKKSDSTSKRTI